jgi:hypothetical protein
VGVPDQAQEPGAKTADGTPPANITRCSQQGVLTDVLGISNATRQAQSKTVAGVLVTLKQLPESVPFAGLSPGYERSFVHAEQFASQLNCLEG